jgi:coatomer subunit beta
MSIQEAACYTVVYEDSSESLSTQDLRNALQKGSDEVKIETLRKIIVLTINGNTQVRPKKFILVYKLLIWISNVLLASVAHAYNSILYAVTQQATEEAITFLLGSLSQIR